MRLNDLFEQFGSTKLAPNAEAVIPPTAVFPDLDNSNSYLQYRFTTNMAAARAVAAGEVPFKKIVPWEQYLTVVGYTPEEIETVKLAAEQSGMRMEMLNTTPSHEPDWVNKISPAMPFHMSEGNRKSVAKNAGLFENDGKQVLIIYPGRFQPVHRGHGAVFNALQEEFGSNVFMATSDKTEPGRSPFNYADKSLMARAAGIPSDKFVQVKSPYSPTEITKLYDPNNTILIFVVGAKDMSNDPRFKFAPKKDGSPSYLQKFKDIAVAEPMSTHGYIMEAPTVEFLVLGHPVTSATQVRKMYANSDNVKRDRILKDLFEQNSVELRQLFDSKLGGSITESAQSNQIVDHMRDFLKIAQHDLQLDHLPKIIWTSSSTAHGERPTFGKFENVDNSITVSIVNRHPIDIMRTLAHELTHYKQDITKGLTADSGNTGSPEEDEANAMAGRIMRHFDEKYPNAFETKPVVAENVSYNDLSYDPADEFDKKDLVNLLYKHRNKLSDRDWDIVERLVNGETFTSVAKDYDYSIENIRRIYYVALRTLRGVLRNKLGSDVDLYNLPAKAPIREPQKSRLYDQISDGYELWLSIKNDPTLKVITRNPRSFSPQYGVVSVNTPGTALTPNVDRLNNIIKLQRIINNRVTKLKHDKLRSPDELSKYKDKLRDLLNTPWYNENVISEEVWDKPNPAKKHKKLSADDKAAAKRRAKSAGRKYPNMVDNIWAARR